MDLSVVVPIKDERDNIKPLHERIRQSLDPLGLEYEIVLVDDMSVPDLREAVASARGVAKVEISGGVTLDRIVALAETGADFVSAGALTHSAPAVDISFRLDLV